MVCVWLAPSLQETTLFKRATYILKMAATNSLNLTGQQLLQRVLQTDNLHAENGCLHLHGH